MVQISVHILLRTNLTQHLTRYELVVLEYIVERVRVKLNMRLKIQVLTQRETAQVVDLHHIAQVFALVALQIHHRRSRKHNVQGFVLVVADTYVVSPVRVLEHLIQEQGLATFLHKLGCKLRQRVL